MASSRDDFIIAIRSAFLKKSTQQKFSLLSLVFVSLFTLILSSYDFRIIKYIKIGISEIVYRSSFIVSIPENFIKNSFVEISDYSTFYSDYKKNKKELNNLKSNYVSSEIIQNENKELKELINDYVSSSNKVLAKIIVDHKSPFLKSIIINKGSKDNIKIGTNIYDQSYLVGRVIEVNFKTSRVLLLSDLNSNVPATIAPQNIQAIIRGSGTEYGQLKYIKDGIFDKFTVDSIVYTSGTGDIFKSGTPIGKLKIIKENKNPDYLVEFYSDFSQLKYVFAEIEFKNETQKSNQDTLEVNNEIKSTVDTKIKILEDELKIIEESNSKFLMENEKLKVQINSLNNDLSNFEKENLDQKKIIDKLSTDEDELTFLRLNLQHSHKCRKTIFNIKGFLVNTPEYKECILSKGKN